MLIGNSLINILEQRNISVPFLAEKVGLSKAGLYRAIERNDFKVSQLQKIADVLEVNICDFFQESDKSSFEKELKYFIYHFQPLFSKVSLEKTDVDFSHNYEEFLRKSLQNIYYKSIIQKPLDYLNKKYKKNIDLLEITNAHRDITYTITCFENNKAEDIECHNTPKISNIFKNLFSNLTDKDIESVIRLAYIGEREFLIFVRDNSFLEWFKDAFKVTDNIIDNILYDIYTDSFIIIDK